MSIGRVYTIRQSDGTTRRLQDVITDSGRTAIPICAVCRHITTKKAFVVAISSCECCKNSHKVNPK